VKRYEGEPIHYEWAGCLTVVVSCAASVWLLSKIISRIL